MGTANAKLSGHMSAIPLYVFVVTVRAGCSLRAPGHEKFIQEGSSGSRKF